ncbi:AsmA family protein [Mesorhizobium sp. BR1-1-16]|nr:AsmA family protein [Mesorhizobium sp. BR1-1-16]
MSRLYLFFGGLIIAVLFAALVVPLFVDWNSYRSSFERQAETIFGQPVHVGGTVSATLLPMPSLVFTDVRVGGSAEQPMLRVARFAMRIELIPLITGDVKVAEMQIDRPELAVTVDDDGKVDWLQRSAASASLNPDAVTLQHVTLKDGAISYLDSRSGRVVALDHIDATVDARSLLGPWKIDGRFENEGRAAAVHIASGRREADGSIRVKLDVVPSDLPVTASAEGLLGEDAKGLNWTGTFNLAEVVTAVEGETKPQPGWRAAGGFELRPDLLRLPELTLADGPDDRPFSLTGAATIALGEEMRFDAVLKSRQVDLDRSIGRGPNEPVDVNAAGGALVAAIASLPRPPIPGRIGFDVPGIVVGGSVVQNLQFDAATDGKGWRIEELAADLPGRTRLSADGTVETAPKVRFIGGVRVASEQPSIFAAWWRDGPAGTRLPLQPFDMSGQIDIAPEQIRISGMSARMQGSNIRGALDWQRDAAGQRALAVDLKADRFDYDQAASLTELFAGRSVTSQGGLADNFRVKLAAGTFIAGDTTLSDVSADGGYADGVLTATRFSVGDLAGAALQASGRLADLDTTPSGQVSASIDASDLRGVADVVERLLPGSGFAAWLTAAAPALQDAKLAAVVNAEAVDGATNANLTLNGSAGGSAVDVALGLSGAPADWHDGSFKLSAAIENPDAGTALRQLGFAAEPVEAPGMLRLTIEGGGALSDGVPLHVKGELAGLGYDVAGRLTVDDSRVPHFAGNATLSGADAGALARLLTGPVPGLASPAPIDIAATLDLAPNRLALAFDKGTLGTAAGSGSLTFAKAGARWGLDGDLSLDQLDLGLMAGLGFGIAPAGAEEGWSDAPFGSPVLPGFDGAVDIKAARLDLGDGLAIGNAVVSARLAGERIDYALSAGDFAGGTATGALSIDNQEGTASVSGQFEIKGAALGSLSWQVDGKPVLTAPLDLSGQFEGSGRSLAGVVATLSGGGSLHAGAGSAAGLDPRAFGATIAAAENGRDLDEAGLRKVFAGFLGAGPLTFSSADGAFSIVAGTVRAQNLDIASDEARIAGGATIDLNQATLASQFTLTAVAGAETTTGAFPQAGIGFSGPLSAPERSLDVTPLLSFLQLRAFEREVQRIEKLQAEILEKEKLGRLVRIGRDEDRRKAEAAERAAEEVAAKAEAERQAAEQAAAAAEADRLAKAEAERQAAAEAQRQADAKAAAEAETAAAAQQRAAEAAAEAEAAAKVAADAKARADEAQKRKAAADAAVDTTSQAAKDAGADADAAKKRAEAEKKADADAIERARKLLQTVPEHLQLPKDSGTN